MLSGAVTDVLPIAMGTDKTSTNVVHSDMSLSSESRVSEFFETEVVPNVLIAESSLEPSEKGYSGSLTFQGEKTNIVQVRNALVELDTFYLSESLGSTSDVQPTCHQSEEHFIKQQKQEFHSHAAEMRQYLEQDQQTSSKLDKNKEVVTENEMALSHMSFECEQERYGVSFNEGKITSHDEQAEGCKLVNETSYDSRSIRSGNQLHSKIVSSRSELSVEDILEKDVRLLQKPTNVETRGTDIDLVRSDTNDPCQDSSTFQPSHFSSRKKNTSEQNYVRHKKEKILDPSFNEISTFDYPDVVEQKTDVKILRENKQKTDPKVMKQNEMLSLDERTHVQTSFTQNIERGPITYQAEDVAEVFADDEIAFSCISFESLREQNSVWSNEYSTISNPVKQDERLESTFDTEIRQISLIHPVSRSATPTRINEHMSRESSQQDLEFVENLDVHAVAADTPVIDKISKPLQKLDEPDQHVMKLSTKQMVKPNCSIHSLDLDGGVVHRQSKSPCVPDQEYSDENNFTTELRLSAMSFGSTSSQNNSECPTKPKQMQLDSTLIQSIPHPENKDFEKDGIKLCVSEISLESTSCGNSKGTIFVNDYKHTQIEFTRNSDKSRVIDNMKKDVKASVSNLSDDSPVSSARTEMLPYQQLKPVIKAEAKEQIDVSFNSIQNVHPNKWVISHPGKQAKEGIHEETFSCQIDRPSSLTSIKNSDVNAPEATFSSTDKDSKLSQELKDCSKESSTIQASKSICVIKGLDSNGNVLQKHYKSPSVSDQVSQVNSSSNDLTTESEDLSTVGLEIGVSSMSFGDISCQSNSDDFNMPQNELNAGLNPTVIQNPGDQVDLARHSSSGDVKFAVNEMSDVREQKSGEEVYENLQVINKDVKSINSRISAKYFNDQRNDDRIMERTYSTAGREKNPYLDMTALREHMAETAEDGLVLREIDENPPVVKKSYKDVRSTISAVFRRNAEICQNNDLLGQRSFDTETHPPPKFETNQLVKENNVSTKDAFENVPVIVTDDNNTSEPFEADDFDNESSLKDENKAAMVIAYESSYSEDPTKISETFLSEFGEKSNQMEQKLEEPDSHVKKISIKCLDLDSDVVHRHSKSPSVPDQEYSDENNFTTELRLSAMSFGSTSSQNNSECPTKPKQMQLDSTLIQSIPHPEKEEFEKDGIELCVSEISFESTSCVSSKGPIYVNDYMHTQIEFTHNSDKTRVTDNMKKDDKTSVSNSPDDSPVSSAGIEILPYQQLKPVITSEAKEQIIVHPNKCMISNPGRQVKEGIHEETFSCQIDRPSSLTSTKNSDVNAPKANFSSTDKNSKLFRELEEYDGCFKESSTIQASKSICVIKGLDSNGEVVQRHSKSPSVSDQELQVNSSSNDLTTESEDLSTVGLEIGISAMSFGNISCQSNSEYFNMHQQMQSKGAFVQSFSSPELEKFKSQENGIELCASEISFESSATNADSERSNDLKNPESYMSPGSPVSKSSSIPQMVPDLQMNSVIRCESEETVVEQFSAKTSAVNLEQKMRDLKKKLNAGKSFPNLLKTSDKEPLEVDQQVFIQYFGSQYCSDNQGPEYLTTEFSPVVRSKSLISLSSDCCVETEVLESCREADTQNATTNESRGLIPKSRTMTLENSLMDIEYLKFMANINDGLDYVSEDLQTVRDYQNHLLNHSSAENSPDLEGETRELSEIKKVLEGIEKEASKIKRMQRKMLINAQNIENQHFNSCSSTMSPSTSVDSVILYDELANKSPHEQIASTDVLDLKSSTVAQVITDYEGLLQDLRSPDVPEQLFREKYDLTKSEVHSLGKEKDILRKISQFKTIKSLVDQVEKTATADASLTITAESSKSVKLQDQLTEHRTDEVVTESSCTVDILPQLHENALMEWKTGQNDEVIASKDSGHKDMGICDDSIIEIIEKEVGDDKDPNSMSDEPHGTVQRAVDMYEQMLIHLTNPEFSERDFNELYDLSKEQMMSFINLHNIAADNWRSTVEDKNFGDTTVLYSKSRRSVWESFKRIAKKSIRSPEKRRKKSREKMKSGSLDSLTNTKPKSRILWDQIKSVTRNSSVQSAGCDPKLVEDKCNETEFEVCNVDTQVYETHFDDSCKRLGQMERSYSSAGREKNPYLDMNALREHMAESAENDPVVKEIDREPPTVKRSYYDIRQKISSIFRKNSCSPEQNKLILEANNLTPRSDDIDGLSPISSFHDFIDDTNLYEDQELIYKGDTSIIESVDPIHETPSIVLSRHIELNTNSDGIVNNGNQGSNVNLECDDVQKNKTLVDAFSQWSSQWSSHESLESMYSVAGRDKNPYLDISGLRKHMAENAENEPVVREIDENPPIVKKSYNDVRNKISTVFRRNAELRPDNDQQSDETEGFSNENGNVFLLPYHDFESNRIVQHLADDRDDENSSNKVNAGLNPTVIQNPGDQIDLAQHSSSGALKLVVNEMFNERKQKSSKEECENLQVIKKDVKSIDTQISGTYFNDLCNDDGMIERTYSTAGREKNPYLDMNALREHMAETAEDGPVVREIDENPPVVKKSYKDVRTTISTIFRRNAEICQNNDLLGQRSFNTETNPPPKFETNQLVEENNVSKRDIFENVPVIVTDDNNTSEPFAFEADDFEDESSLMDENKAAMIIAYKSCYTEDPKQISEAFISEYGEKSSQLERERTYSTAGREKNPYLDMNALREHMAETAEDGPVLREIDENPPVVKKSYKNVRNKISSVFRQNSIVDHYSHQVEQTDTEELVSQKEKCDNMQVIVPDISHSPELLETKVSLGYDESNDGQNVSPSPEFGPNNFEQVVDNKSSLKEVDINNNMTINGAAQNSAYQSDCTQPTCGGEVEPKSSEYIFKGIKVFDTDINDKSELLGSREDNRDYSGNIFVHSEHLSTNADQMDGPQPVKTENQDVVRVLKSRSLSAIPADEHDVDIKRGSKSLYNLDASCCDDCGNIAITATVESDDVVELKDLINVLEDCKSLLPDHFPCQIETSSESSEISIKVVKSQSSANKIDVEAFIENVLTSAVEKAELCIEDSPSGTETDDKRASWAVEDETDINLNYHNSLASIAKRLSCSLKETFEEIADDGITFDTHGLAENDISDVCSEDFSLDVPLLAHKPPTEDVNSESGDSIKSMANTPEQLESPRIITASNTYDQTFEHQHTGSHDNYPVEAETAPHQSRYTNYSESETREQLTTVGNTEFSQNLQTAGPSRSPEKLALEVPQYSEMRRTTVSMQPSMIQKDLLTELGKHLKAREDHIKQDPLTVEGDSPSKAVQSTKDSKTGQSGSPKKRKLFGKVFRNRKVFKFCFGCKSKCKQRIRASRHRERPSSQ